MPVGSAWEREWATDRWRDEVTAWADHVLGEHGIARTGPVEQPRLRLWSTALLVPTDAGRYWFKVNCPGLRAEAAVVGALAQLAPDHVVAPLAVDPARGWMLTPDHGRTLREAGASDEPTWTRIVTEYADLQRRTVGHGDLLGAAGIASLEPQDAAPYVEDRLRVLGGLPEDHPRHLDPGLRERVTAVLPALEKVGALLATGPVPCALDHNDLHDANTFVPAGDETTLRFSDFGDALWGHPFASMTIVVNVVTDPDEMALDQASLGRLLDAYLSRWVDLAPLEELRELLDAALVLGRVHRLLSWERSLVDVPPEAMGEHAASPVVWLELLARCLEPGGRPRVL